MCIVLHEAYVCVAWCGTTIPFTHCASSTPPTTPVWHQPPIAPVRQHVGVAELCLSVPPVILQCCVASVHGACVVLVVWSSLICVPALLAYQICCGVLCGISACRVALVVWSCLFRACVMCGYVPGEAVVLSGVTHESVHHCSCLMPRARPSTRCVVRWLSLGVHAEAGSSVHAGRGAVCCVHGSAFDWS